MANPLKFDVEIIEKPIYCEAVVPMNPGSSFKKSPLFLMRRQVIYNGIENTMDESFVNRFIDRMQTTQLFSSVHSFQTMEKPEKFFDFFLSAKQDIDTHQGKSVLNIGMAALTYGLSTLVLKGKADFSFELTSHVQRSDGVAKSYFARSSGIAKIGTFSNGSLAGNKLTESIVSLCLNSIANQVSQDNGFYNF